MPTAPPSPLSHQLLKQVQRFTPEELLALRKAPTRPLSKMPILGADISVIVSEEPLDPVTATPPDQEAVNKVRRFAIILFRATCPGIDRLPSPPCRHAEFARFVAIVLGLARDPFPDSLLVRWALPYIHACPARACDWDTLVTTGAHVATIVHRFSVDMEQSGRFFFGVGNSGADTVMA